MALKASELKVGDSYEEVVIHDLISGDLEDSQR